MGTPSTLLQVGRSLTELAVARKAVCIKEKNPEGINEANLFLDLHSHEWEVYQAHAYKTIYKRKDKIPEMLPLASDLKIFRNYTVKVIEKLVEEHQENLPPTQWKFLLKVVICRLITCNARRGGNFLFNIFYVQSVFSFVSLICWLLK